MHVSDAGNQAMRRCKYVQLWQGPFYPNSMRAPKGGTSISAVAADDVEDAGGQANLVRDSGQFEAGHAAHL
jgi:hypothetical protein